MKPYLHVVRRVGLTAAVVVTSLALLAVSVAGCQPVRGVDEAAPAKAPTAQSPVQGSGGQEPSVWTRGLEPVILTGGQLPEFGGVALHDLFVYAYDGSAWQAVPYQFDEVDADGNYTSLDDGLLGPQDELALMAVDLGQEATASEWIDDVESQSFPRYEVQVTNPLTPTEQGWVYVYRSSTLPPPSFTPYVSWDSANNRILAGTYIAGLNPSNQVGLASLELNGTGVNVLDRTKIRAEVIIIPPFGIVLTEEDLAGYFQLVPTDLGPVRVGGGTTDSNLWAYSSVYAARLALDSSSLPFNPEWVRVSSDWLDPATSGMEPMTYYDGNTLDGVTIDGLADDVPSTPPVSWQQVDGTLGSVVTVLDIDPGGGTVTNYYEDDQNFDPNDTGDGKSYGDAGAVVTDPSGMLSMDLISYCLPPNPGMRGPAFEEYHANPLVPIVAAQSYEPPCLPPADLSFSWAPVPVYTGVETTFTASVGSGDAPFAYAWAFGDGGSAPGNPAVHTYAAAGTVPVTLTVINFCGSADLVQNVYVSEPVPPVYLPVIMGNYP